MSLKRIQSNLLHEVSKQAALKPRQRLNHNFHQPEEVLQRFLNAVEPESYVCPHQHISPPMPEVMILLQGKAGIVTFDEKGNIEEAMMLDPKEGLFGVEIPPAAYHTLFSLESGSVFFEVKEGPYNPEAAKHFAPWAPKEGEEGTAEYLQRLKKLFWEKLN